MRNCRSFLGKPRCWNICVHPPSTQHTSSCGLLGLFSCPATSTLPNSSNPVFRSKEKSISVNRESISTVACAWEDRCAEGWRMAWWFQRAEIHCLPVEILGTSCLLHLGNAMFDDHENLVDSVTSHVVDQRVAFPLRLPCPLSSQSLPGSPMMPNSLNPAMGLASPLARHCESSEEVRTVNTTSQRAVECVAC